MPEGSATKSVDDLLRVPPAARGVPSEEIRSAILRELASGAKKRKYLDDIIQTSSTHQRMPSTNVASRRSRMRAGSRQARSASPVSGNGS